MIRNLLFSASIFILGAGLLTTSPVSHAEVIKIGISQQGSDRQSVQLPRAGMSKADVETEFGAPVEQKPTIGEPPISTWVYSEFSVYFENDTVLHAVVHHRAPASEE